MVIFHGYVSHNQMVKATFKSSTSSHPSLIVRLQARLNRLVQQLLVVALNAKLSIHLLGQSRKRAMGHDSGTDLLLVPPRPWQAEISGNISTNYGLKYGTMWGPQDSVQLVYNYNN